jgi:hypothetical protein
MTALSLSSTIRLNENVVFRSIDGEGVLIDPAGGSYFGLGSVGTRVWSLLREQRSLPEIVEALTLEFECSERQCAGDLLEFLEELAGRGLVTVTPLPADEPYR